MDISAEITAIQAASEGSALRQPIIDALTTLNSGALPAVTAADTGKILKVGANGWEVGEKSGYMPIPSATRQITDNGSYDVTNYSLAVVNVSGGGGGGQTGAIGTNDPPQGANVGDLYLQFWELSGYELDEPVSVICAINGGYNGGAVITVTVGNENSGYQQIFRAVGDSPYNLNYTITQDSDYVSVTAPSNSNDIYGLHVTFNMNNVFTLDLNPTASGSNTSYGYGTQNKEIRLLKLFVRGTNEWTEILDLKDY